MLTAISEPRRSMRRVPLIALVVLLIAGLFGMHALASGSTAVAARAPMASSGHASTVSPGMTDEEAAAPASTTSGPHGTVHGCADAMSGGDGSTCVSVPTGNSVPALPPAPAASLPGPVFTVLSLPPPETPRRLALSHRELSIYRT